MMGKLLPYETYVGSAQHYSRYPFESLSQCRQLAPHQWTHLLTIKMTSIHVCKHISGKSNKTSQSDSIMHNASPANTRIDRTDWHGARVQQKKTSLARNT